MKSKWVHVIIFGLLFFTFVVQGRADDQAEVFTGLALATGNIATGKTAYVKIRVTRWTTDEEREQLLRTLAEKGTEKMVDLLHDLKPTGSIAFRGGLSYDLHYARQAVQEGKRRIILATDRPMSFPELWVNGRSVTYSVSLIQLLTTPDGKGEGTIAAAVKLKFEPKEKTLEVENYGTEPLVIRGLKKED